MDPGVIMGKSMSYSNGKNVWNFTYKLCLLKHNCLIFLQMTRKKKQYMLLGNYKEKPLGKRKDIIPKGHQ